MVASGHPSWCDRELCTAPAEQPTEYGTSGQHVSALVVIETDSVRTGGMVPLGDVTAQLYQEVWPWPCEVYLRIRFGSGVGSCMTMTLTQAADNAALLGELAAAGSADTATIAAARGRAGGHGTGRVHVDLTGLEAESLIRAATGLLNGRNGPGPVVLIGRESAALTRAHHKLSIAASQNPLCTAHASVHGAWLTCDADQHSGPEHHDPSGVTWRADRP
jgi:hypothetical protein